jgi:hypothetical protein
MLAELGVRHDARRRRRESQAKPKTIRFLLAIVCDEYLRAFGSGIPSRIRRPCESGAAGDQNDRCAGVQRARQRRLAKLKGDLDVRLPVDRELRPALLVQWRGRWERAGAQNQDVGLKHVEHSGRRALICCIERQNVDTGDVLAQLFKRASLPRHREHARAVAGGGFHDLPSHPAAAADHDHCLAGQ